MKHLRLAAAARRVPAPAREGQDGGPGSGWTWWRRFFGIVTALVFVFAVAYLAQRARRSGLRPAASSARDHGVPALPRLHRTLTAIDAPSALHRRTATRTGRRPQIREPRGHGSMDRYDTAMRAAGGRSRISSRSGSSWGSSCSLPASYPEVPASPRRCSEGRGVRVPAGSGRQRRPAPPLRLAWPQGWPLPGGHRGSGAPRRHAATARAGSCHRSPCR
ncbi:hypothetical protein QJS66_11330 [Kocuria rhizophila]|nr:hypothetical protein QJS66_11330 [Kocuria rhizophila]